MLPPAVKGSIAYFADRPAAFFAAVALLFSLPYFALGPFSYFPHHDLADSHFTRYISNVNARGSLAPFYWNPFAAMGVDFLANGQRPYDGFAFLFATLPDWLVLAIARFAHLFLSGYFAWRVLVDYGRLAPIPAFVGASLLLGYHPPLLELFFGYGTVPFLMWALPILCRRWWTLVLGSALAGFALGFVAFLHLTTYIVAPFLFVWMVLGARVGVRRTVAALAVFTVFTALSQIEMLGAMFANAPISHRAVREGARALYYTLGPYEVVPGAIILLGLALKGYRDRFLLWATASTVLFILLTLMLYGLQSPALPMPKVITALSAGRILELLPFSLALGAGAALPYIMQRAPLTYLSTDRWMPVLVAAFMALALLPLFREAAGAARDWVKWGSYASVFRIDALEDLAAKQTPQAPFRVATIKENGLYPAAATFYGLETADNYLNMAPAGYYRFWGVLAEPGRSRNPDWERYYRENGSRLGLWTDDGHGLPLETERYFHEAMLALAGVRYLITNVPLENPALRLVEGTQPDTYWDALSSFAKGRKRLVENFTGRHVMLYELAEPLPRWRLVTKVRTFTDADALFAGLAAGTRNDFRDAVWLTDGAAAGLAPMPENAAPGIVTMKTYTNDEIALETISDTPAVLVVSNNYSPYWKADIDGAEAPLLPAYGTFWAVPVPAGTHRVTFRYDPPYALFK